MERERESQTMLEQDVINVKSVKTEPHLKKKNAIRIFRKILSTTPVYRRIDVTTSDPVLQDEVS